MRPPRAAAPGPLAARPVAARPVAARPLAALAVTAALGLGLAGGGGGAAGGRPPLPAGARVLARGSLAYAVVATAGAVVTIELEERFALVVRDPDTGRPRTRVELGPAERDLVAVAAAGDRAWVGGDDRQVRAVDLAAGRVIATWPHGADVTALRWLPGDRDDPAAAAGWLAIGDASGAVCLRRLADGALVQCAALATGPVTALEAGGGLTVVAGGGRSTWTVPALAAAPPAPPPRWRDQPVTARGREVWLGDRLLIRMGERVRAIEVGPSGALFVAAWVARLDDPSVIALPADARW